ncbi:MAG TPA: hypothetical protein VMZ71_12360, partial [Gemmataceae bacterium]|nr:hypothetical protein [Gemmataceae bacterium]
MVIPFRAAEQVRHHLFHLVGVEQVVARVQQFLALGHVVIDIGVEAGRVPVADAGHLQAEDQPGGELDGARVVRPEHLAE